MEQRIRLGISSRLLGHKVRFDGGHKLDCYLANTLAKYVEFVPVCPEVECRFPVPRESLRLVGDPESPRLVTTRTAQDLKPDTRLVPVGNPSGNFRHVSR